MSFLKLLLSNQEKDNIERYIDEYGFNTKRTEDPQPLDYILRLWDSAKSKYLFKLFGGKDLIIHRSIQVKKSDNELYDDCKDKLWVHPFYRAAIELTQTGQPLYGQYYFLQLFTFNSLMTNTYDEKSFTCPLPNGKTYRVEQGVKTMRALGKIAKAYNIPHFEDFCIVHSQILNQKKVDGNLYLSIHPLDYLTMSDNASNWTSCMNWKNAGEYRMGTVEMMNSPCVVVAYVTNERDPYYLFNNSNARWPNKKWRELFIVDKGVITGIKGYPYKSRKIERMVADWLRELAKENLNWDYDDKYYVYYEDSRINDFPKTLEKTQIIFKTNVMYNDFEVGNQHRGYFNIDEIKMRSDWYGQFTLNYSGFAECMNCGKKLDYSTVPNSNAVFCYDCEKHSYFKCVHCGSVFIDEEVNGHWLNSTDWICEDCYENYYFCCGNCSKVMHEAEARKIHIIFDKNTIMSGRFIYFCPDCYRSFVNKGYIQKFRYQGILCEGIHYNTLSNERLFNWIFEVDHFSSFNLEKIELLP